jgi:hypothetical protein
MEVGWSARAYLESKNFLTSLVSGKSVYIDIDDISRTDQYGRYVCSVLVEWNSSHFLNVNKTMVDNGHAVASDYTNNEFNPYTWNLYYSINDVSVIPGLSAVALLLFGLAIFSITITKRTKRARKALITSLSAGEMGFEAHIERKAMRASACALDRSHSKSAIIVW